MTDTTVNFDLERMKESIECLSYIVPSDMTFAEFKDWIYNIGEQNEINK